MQRVEAGCVDRLKAMRSIVNQRLALASTLTSESANEEK
jgi:hypothetical protein